MVSKAVKSFSILIIHFTLVTYGDGWRAVPANQARYALRGPTFVKSVWGDDWLPRRYLHSTYKFGYCSPMATSRQFLKRKINLTFVSFHETDVRYIYLLAELATQRYFMQCLVMRLYTAAKYLFFMSRFPIYYCQGKVNLLMLKTVQQIAIHEFYIQMQFRLPCTIVFSFYQPMLDVGYYTKVDDYGWKGKQYPGGFPHVG